MGIDVLVGSLSGLWQRETRERLAVFVEATQHMTDDPAAFSSSAWRKRLAKAPSSEGTVDDLLTAISASKGANIVATVNAMDAERQRHRATEAEVRAAVERVVSALRAKLGSSASWREDSSAEPTLVGNLAPNGMLALRTVATDLATQSAPEPRGRLDRLWRVLRRQAWRESVLRRRFPQIACLEIDNAYLPDEFDRVLGSFPFHVGSAPALGRELEELSRRAASRLRDDSVQHNLELLGIATAKASARGVPMFVLG
ncbi:MAG: hypothetical protein IT379_37925 [Deltaproteobacteria bacterium]|nr:hypothetical protein [Deltaproteobacteria bacterium]